MNDGSSFKISIINLEEMIINFKDKKYKLKNKYKKYKTPASVLESDGTVLNFRATTASLILSVTGVGLILLPISPGIAFVLSLVNKVLREIILKKYIKYKKHYQKNQETFKSFDKLYSKRLQDVLIDRKEYESACSFFFTRYVDEAKNEPLLLKYIETFFH